MSNSLYPANQSQSRRPDALLYQIICWLLILAFALFFSVLAVRQHHAFQTNALDLGNVDQALWNTAHGRFLQFTLMTPIQSRLALHVEPILLLFVPLYWLNLGGPETLLIVQAMVVAIGAWPLYQLSIINYQLSIIKGLSLFTMPSSLSAWLCLIFPLAYLLLPTLESAVLYDFHALTLAPTWLLFAFLALEQKKDRRFLFFTLLAMACKEDMPLVVALLGVYLGLARRRWRLAGVTIGLSAVWFATAVFIIQPYFAAGGNIQLERYAWLGDSPLEKLQTLLTQPVLVFNHLWDQANLPGYLVALFFPTAFLALFSPLTLLPLLPPLAINLLSNNPFTWRLEDFHYGAPLAPFLFVSAIYGLRRVTQRVDGLIANYKSQITSRYSFVRYLPWLSLSLLMLACSFTYHYYRGFTPLARPFVWPPVTAHHQGVTEGLSTIPIDAPLFAQSNLAPHLTHRPFLYNDFAYFTDPAYPAPVKAQEILLDLTALENRGGLHQFLRRTLLESGRYQLITAADGILRFQPTTTASPSPLPSSFYTFSQPDSSPPYSVTADFGDLLRLHGYSLHFNRQEEIEVSVDLEALKPLAASPELQPVLYLLDAEGQPVGATTDLPPILVWYPLAQWPVREVVRVRFNTLPWYTRDTESYRLALGLVNDRDPWEVNRRYRPTLSQSGDWGLRLPADGTLLELARLHHVWGMPEGGPPRRQFTQPNLTHPLPADFAGQVKLLGYDTPQITNDQSPNSNLEITLAWQALTRLEPLTRFVQLIGPDGQIYGQNDSAPDRGQYPTNLWQPGEIVVETVTIPLQPNRPPGQYTLHLGFYQPHTGTRLLLTSGGDHVEIYDLRPVPR